MENRRQQQEQRHIDNPPRPPEIEDEEEPKWRKCWSYTVHTLCFLSFELTCFVALLSISIGLSTLISRIDVHFLHANFGVFYQTYITMLILYNFSLLQSRHQINFLYPRRNRFGNQSSFCFECNYPCSIFFVMLAIAYAVIAYLVLRLACSVPTENSDGNSTELDAIASQSRVPRNQAETGIFSDVQSVTTAFLFCLCVIQYISCRKLKWDAHFEGDLWNYEPERRPTCSVLICSLSILLFVQLILSVLYVMPLILWLSICGALHLHLTATVFTTMIASVIVGHLATYIEQLEPFTTVNQIRVHQLMNMKVRRYLMCLLYIPGIAYWYFKIDGFCPTLFLSAREHQSGSSRDSHEFKPFHLFLLTICVCILNTIKYARMSCLALQVREERIRHGPPPPGRRVREANQVAPQIPPRPSYNSSNRQRQVDILRDDRGLAYDVAVIRGIELSLGELGLPVPTDNSNDPNRSSHNPDRTLFEDLPIFGVGKYSPGNEDDPGHGKAVQDENAELNGPLRISEKRVLLSPDRPGHLTIVNPRIISQEHAIDTRGEIETTNNFPAAPIDTVGSPMSGSHLPSSSDHPIVPANVESVYRPN